MNDDSRLYKLFEKRVWCCFHACSGIPTEALEAGVVREMVNMVEEAYLELNTILSVNAGLTIKEKNELQTKLDIIKPTFLKLKGGAE